MCKDSIIIPKIPNKELKMRIIVLLICFFSILLLSTQAMPYSSCSYSAGAYSSGGSCASPSQATAQQPTSSLAKGGGEKRAEISKPIGEVVGISPKNGIVKTTSSSTSTPPTNQKASSTPLAAAAQNQEQEKKIEEKEIAPSKESPPQIKVQAKEDPLKLRTTITAWSLLISLVVMLVLTWYYDHKQRQKINNKKKSVLSKLKKMK